MRVLVVVALVGLWGPSWAVTNTSTPAVLSQVSARTVNAIPGTSSTWAQWANAGLFPSYGAGSPLGTVVAQTIQKGPSPMVGEVIDVAVKRSLPWASISRAVAKSLPLISTALAIKEIADAIRCREAVGGAAECDVGTDETMQPAPCWKNDVQLTTCMSSPSAAAVAIANVIDAANSGYGFTNTTQPAGAETSCGTNCRDVNVPYKRVRDSNGQIMGTPDRLIRVINTPTNALACPSIIVNGVTLVPVKGPDGKCATNVYQPASEDAVATKAETWGDKTKAPLIVGDLNAAGKPIDHPFPTVDPVPDSVVGPRETTTHPDGSTTIKDTIWDLAPTPTGYGWTPRTVTKDYPPGATIPPPGTVTDGTSTTGSAPKDDPITCGLPNTPACKIDETGTPTTGTISKAEADAAKASALGKITEIGAIQAPAWTWSFSLPTVCSPITVGPFLTQTVTVDLCQYQPMIHDLVALIWAAFTVWACVGMVGRTFATG